MRTSRIAILAALAAAAALGAPGEALANGGHFHFGAGSVGIPLVAVYGVGGFVGVMMLFFLANWARFRRLQSRGDPSSRSESPQPQDEEEDHGIRGEGE